MKQFNTVLLIVFSFLFFSSLKAQVRYLNEVYTDVDVQTGLVCGENFTLEYILTGDTTTRRQELLFDFYEPAGDTATERPLVLLLKGGNFLPIVTNGSVFGTRADSALVEIATRLAKRGYVVASLDYRLGWNPFAETQPERALGLIQAAYRGLQDARTAVRFFRRDYAENNNSFGIDTSRITMWGVGTGGYISLVTMALDRFEEIPNTTSPPGKFVIVMSGVPVPMVFPPVNGDIEGFGLGLLPQDNPPLMAGDTLNVSNHVGYSSDYHLTVNMGGALGDISWLEAGDTPVICFHVPTDPNAPYIDDVLVVPTTMDPIVQVQGSKLVVENANSLGNNASFAMVEDIFGEDAYTAAAKANSSLAGHAYFEGLYPFPRGTNIYGEEEGGPWNWWDPNASADPEIYTPWNMFPINPDDPSGLTFHEFQLLNNADMSREKAQTYIDTIMGYFAPRAYLALQYVAANFEVEPQDQGVVAFTDRSINADSWLWDFGDGNTSTDQNPTHTYLQNGTYDVCLTASNIASSATSCQVVDISTSLEVLQREYGFQLFPNPVRDQLQLRFDPPETASPIIVFSSLSGQILYRAPLTNRLQVDTGDWPAGAYNFSVYSREGTILGSGKIQVVK